MLQLKVQYDRTKNRFQFFKLPGEIRNLIYQKVLEPEPDIIFSIPKLLGPDDHMDLLRKISIFTEVLNPARKNNLVFIYLNERINIEASRFYTALTVNTPPFPKLDTLAPGFSTTLQSEIDTLAIKNIGR